MDMDIERETGVKIKFQATRVLHRSDVGGQVYTLNLIDTNRHVGFSYKVSRSLADCEGALLLVNTSQEIDAQVRSMFYQLAFMLCNTNRKCNTSLFTELLMENGGKTTGEIKAKQERNERVEVVEPLEG